MTDEVRAYIRGRPLRWIHQHPVSDPPTSNIEPQSRSSATMPKRKSQQHTVEFKLDVISRVKRGESKAAISRDIGVPESTIRGWVKEEEKLRAFLQTIDADEGMQRKRTRQAENTELDKAMFSFFVEKRNDGIPLSGTILQAQAETIQSKANADEYRCSK